MPKLRVLPKIASEWPSKRRSVNAYTTLEVLRCFVELEGCMQTVDSTAVLEGWLSGSESVHGLANAAEAALVDPTDMLYAFCSSPTGSHGSWCC
jgi:hypothetical protein